MLDELSDQTKISQELKTRLLARIKQRRTLISDVFQYLNDPTPIKDDHGLFQKLSKSAGILQDQDG
jgi:hypothetical protein